MSKSIIFNSVYKDVEIPNHSVYETVLNGMKKIDPNRPALIDYDSEFTITYGELPKYITTISNSLRVTYGMKKGDCFAIVLPNHPFYPCLFHGIGLSGGIATTVNPLYKGNEIHKQLVDSKAKYICTIGLFLDAVLEGIKDTNVTKVFLMRPPTETGDLPTSEHAEILDFKALLKPTECNLDPVEIDPKNDLVCLPYSSGTTGLSKGVMLSHYNLVSNLYQIDPVEPFEEDDVICGFLPFFHIFGMIVVLNKALMTGCKIVTFPKFDFVKFLTSVQKYKVTKVHLVPPIVNGLVNNPGVCKKFDLSSLKSLLSGAAPLSGSLAKKCQDQLNVPVRIGYGLTESSPVISACPPDDNVIGSCGKLVPNAQLRIVHTETGEDLDRNQDGEIVFKGPNVFQGYLEQPEATKRTIRDGWLFTGDIGHLDDNNNIFISDRLKELIKRSGFQVEPAYLEGVLLTNDSIADAAVIGVPDDKAGEVPKAFVVKAKGQEISEEEVKKFVADQVVYYKKIEYVEFVDEIPKSRSGKILRRILRDQERQKEHSRNQS